MRIHVCAMGRMRSGPERALCDDYRVRFDRTGRALGLGPLSVHEADDRKGGGPAGEATVLRRTIPDGAAVCALDERGQTLSSPGLADLLGGWRDQGRADVAFVIGGADGLDLALRDSADLALSLGAMVWPHLLVRVMLLEQLYRAAGILAGTPYHRA